MSGMHIYIKKDNIAEYTVGVHDWSNLNCLLTIALKDGKKIGRIVTKNELEMFMAWFYNKDTIRMEL